MIDLLRDGIERALAAEGTAAALARHAGGDAAELTGLAGAIEPFLRHLPDAVAFAIRASKDEHVGRAVAFANGQVLHYLVDDEDLLPERELGVLGLLDDAFLAHHHAAQLLTWAPGLHAVAGSYEVPAPSTFAVVRDLLPDGVADALERTSRNVLHVAISLVGGRVAEGAPAIPAVPRLRVDLARRAL
jgi:hypothetical protein